MHPFSRCSLNNSHNFFQPGPEELVHHLDVVLQEVVPVLGDAGLQVGDIHVAGLADSPLNFAAGAAIQKFQDLGIQALE